MKPSLAFVREAFAAAGEKHFVLARVLYSTLFGADWGQAILGFAYLKTLDDLVDEDRDAGRAREVLAAQLRFIDRVYAGRPLAEARHPPERFGHPFFSHDQRCGAPLRATFEAILATMDLDTRRRGRPLTAAALDTYVLELGGGVLRFLMHFAAPGVVLPAPFLAHASRAYLYADALIDLEHDLALNLINVPAEDIGRYHLSLDPSDPRLRAWAASEAGRVLASFDAALAEGRRLERWSLRLLATLYLSSKRRKLLRFLAAEGLAPARQAAAA
jgi:hypothetical protein